MLQTIKGHYNNGIVVLDEQPSVKNNAPVYVMFIEEKNSEPMKKKERKIGGLEGFINVPDDFNDPLDDLKEYM